MPERGYWGLIEMSRRVVKVHFWIPKRLSAPKLTLAEPRAEGGTANSKGSLGDQNFPLAGVWGTGNEAPPGIKWSQGAAD